MNSFFTPTASYHIDREAVFYHRMSCEASIEVTSLIERAVRKHELPMVVWGDGESFVVFLQLYSDKTAMYLKSSSFTLSPFHMIPSNFDTST